MDQQEAVQPESPAKPEDRARPERRGGILSRLPFRPSDAGPRDSFDALIRQVSSGLWTFMPAGWRAHRKVEQIVREELDAIGGQEMLMPVMLPAELWKKTGRYDIDELFKLKDRKSAALVLAMTHEEVLTFHIGRDVRSYRELPMILYHVQTKERDEHR